MTPTELSRELTLGLEDFQAVCALLKIPMAGEQGFSSEQVQTIIQFVEQKRAAQKKGNVQTPLPNFTPIPPNEPLKSRRSVRTVLRDEANDLQDLNIPDMVSKPVSPPPKQVPSNEAKPSEPVVGKYRLIRTLGSGGMGQVWLARDTVADIDVALKVLPEAFRTNSDEQERLKRSFQMVQALPPHKSICQLRDLQHDPDLGYYLVMEYIGGITLSMYRYEYERQHGSFPLSELVRVLDMVADALDYGHERKLIHRDIKPSNVLISHDGQQVRVIDFQLAWEIRTTTSRITRDQKVDNAGTYPYMAPELWLGQRASARSDQYALAMLTFELLDGHLPFEASDQSSWTIIVKDPNTRIPEIDGLPTYAQNSLARALHFDPKQRFDTCRQFVEAIGGRESRETENFVKWKTTDAARKWVAAKNGTWTHQDWLQLLEPLRRSEFWPMREADIGELLDELRNDLQASKRQKPVEVDVFIDEDSATAGDQAIGKQVNVVGYPPLSDELLAAEVEHQRQLQLLKQVEDGVHSVLSAGRERLTELQRSFDALNKDHERKQPQAAPGVLETITDAVSRDANVSLGKLAEIPNAPGQDDLFGYVQRLKRVITAKKDLENAQKQALVDRQTFADKLQREVDQTFARLLSLRELDYGLVCRKLFDRTPSAKISFPTELWIRELPNIRVRRYHWSDQELLSRAERECGGMGDDLAFESAQRRGSEEAYTTYVTSFPRGKHLAEAKAVLSDYASKVAEEQAWRSAVRDDRIYSYRNFMRCYEQSAHCRHAQSHIARLERPDRIKNGFAQIWFFFKHTNVISWVFYGKDIFPYYLGMIAALIVCMLPCSIIAGEAGISAGMLLGYAVFFVGVFYIGYTKEL